VRTHFKHSIELVDDNAEIVDQLAGVQDFMLAPLCDGRIMPTYFRFVPLDILDSPGGARMLAPERPSGSW
jgi:hypothetical protein